MNRTWLPTPHIATTSSPMKRARKHVAQQHKQQHTVHLQLAATSRRSRLINARDLIPHQRISEWFRRFHRVCSQWRKNARVGRHDDNVHNSSSSIRSGIHALVRSATQQIRARLQMPTMRASTDVAATHTGTHAYACT